jgi:hypothetical protein
VSLAGPGPREQAGIAVCEGDNGFYMFTCDADWRVMWDQWAEDFGSIERQAEFSYPGIRSRWKRAVV